MIEQWFKQDIEAHLNQGKRVVVLDPNGNGAFLLSTLTTKAIVLTVNNHLDEIACRYKAEKYYADSNVIFYSMLSKEDISFLLEYAQVNGMVDLTDIEQYIKNHLFATAGINTTIPKSELILAAKLGIGKDINWWKGVATGIIQPFKMDECLLSFICNPDEYINSLDISVKELFIDELYKLIGKPKVNQTNDMMAQEVMFSIFNGLLKNNLSSELLNVYYALTDKISSKPTMDAFLDAFELPKDASPLSAHIDHPFIDLDKKLVLQLSDALKEDTEIFSYLHAINQRIDSKYAQSYKACWLKDLSILFEYDKNAFNKVTSLETFVQQYKSDFHRIDNAMRKIYVGWLNKPDILRPIQYYYEQLSKPMFDRWYSFAKEYIPTQKNIVIDALQQKGRIAVIVGDGLRLEIAKEIADEVNRDKDINFDSQTAFAMLPSVTENGMSALYGCDGVELLAQNRYKKVKELVADTTIMSLDAFNESITAEKLVLTYGDIDQIGEKKQLSGLKDISCYPAQIAETVKQLLAMGYNKVYITADHGFVITGILDEADKIPVPNNKDAKVEERFILTNEPISKHNLMERTGDFCGFNYQYYAPTDKPFVSRGVYGYAHGGYSPQECIIPMFCFSKEKNQDGCIIKISNKNDLKSVTGSYFTAKISAEGDVSQLFKAERKVKLQLFDSKGKVQSSTIHTIQADKTFTQEFEIVSSPCKLVVIDFYTTEQLDSCEVGKSTARDIDDLF